MSEVLSATRCPQCAALVRPGQPWCTLCHADLRPAPVAEIEAVVTADVAPTIAPTVVPPSPSGSTAPTPGKHARVQDLPEVPPKDGAAASVLSDEEIDGGLSEGEIDAMLSQLAAQTAAPLGGVSERLDSRSAKVIAAVVLCIGATAVLLLVSVLLGAILG